MNYLYSTMMYINVLWTQMSRQWMYMADRRSKEFMDGVHEFIEAAEKHKYGGFVRCPCKFCKNEKDYSSSRTIHSHLFNSGFMPNYYVWTKHGERGIVLDNNVEEEDRIPDFAANYNAFFNNTAMGETEEDTERYVAEDDLGQMLRETEEGCETEKESRDLKRMLEDYRTLYREICVHYIISIVSFRQEIQRS